MKYYINYADDNFAKQQSYASKQALKYGFDKVIEYTPANIPDSFKSSNPILNESKGGGYWLWKPYIIIDCLNKINDDDILFYCDSGAFVVNDMSPLFEILLNDANGMIAFNLPLEETQWTKSELFNHLNVSISDSEDVLQVLASFILIKKNDFTMNFFKEFLEVAQIENMINDNFDKKNQTNNFISHRHDQSIFSLLCKKYNIKRYRDPSQFGSFPGLFSGNNFFYSNTCLKMVVLKSNVVLHFITSKNSPYKQLILHTRGSNPFKYKIKLIFIKIFNKAMRLFDDFINNNSCL